MHLPDFRFRLIHLFAAVLWLSVFLALVVGHSIEVILPALIGNGLTFFLPFVVVAWLGNIRKELHQSDKLPIGFFVAMIHWTNLIFLGLIFTCLVILAALWQFCWVRGSLSCAIANITCLPVASYVALTLGWQLFHPKPVVSRDSDA